MAHALVGRHMGDVDDLEVVEHGQRRRVVKALDELDEMMLSQLLQVHRFEVAGTQREHLGPEQEAPLVPAHVAELPERDQRAANGGRAHGGAPGNLAQRHFRCIGTEGLDDLEAARQGGDEVARVVPVGCRLGGHEL